MHYARLTSQEAAFTRYEGGYVLSAKQRVREYPNVPCRVQFVGPCFSPAAEQQREGQQHQNPSKKLFRCGICRIILEYVNGSLMSGFNLVLSAQNRGGF